MAVRFAILGDVHGNLAALDAALADIKRHKPDRLLITGDLVFFGPRPVEVVDRVRKLESDGAVVIQGNTDIVVADFDYAAAFHGSTKRLPATAPRLNGRTTSSPTTSWTGCAGCRPSGGCGPRACWC